MTFNWFTFFAQIVNFLVLVALLKRFLYGPIINAMQRREEELESSRKKVQQHLRQAEEQTEEYRQRLATLDRQRKEMLEAAEQEVDDLRKKMLTEARDTVDRRREDWMQTVEREKKSLARQLRRRACKEVVSTTRRTLEALSDVDLEERIIMQFLRKIELIDEDARREIVKAVSGNGDAVTIRTSFDVAGELQKRIHKKLTECLQLDRDVTFHTTGDVVCGIELQVSGNKLAWSVDEFLSSMEEELEHQVI